MKQTLSLALIACFLAGPAFAQQPLPISRILLYKNGMAYVVRTGQIQAPLTLTFRPDEMNDLLKTFTAWNPSTSALYSVGFTTGVAADYLLERFPFDLREGGAGLGSFLGQIKGARLKLDLGARTISGQLVAIIEEDRAVQQQTIVKDHRVTVLAGGSVQTVWLSDVRSLELEDPELSGQLRSYLEILAEGHQDVTREITVYPPAAAAPINVAYVQQFPVWKTSYRLDLAKTGSRIQGWSQIDNPSGETWDNVDLTLISGMPTSFIMNLYEPLYTSRETVPVPMSVAAAPRQYEAALSRPTDLRAEADARGEEVEVQAKSSGVASGVMGGVLRSNAESAPPPPPPPPPPAFRRQAADTTQTAEVARVEDYFEYHFPAPVRLAGRQSALLPFLNKPLNVERLSIYKSGVDRDHPLNGAMIENNSEVPLEPGPLTFFQDGRYSGETVLDYLSRGEQRLVSYGVDYDIQADTRRAGAPEVLTRVSAANGVVTFHRESVQTTSYRFRNKGQEAKTIVLEHPRDGQKALKDLKPTEETATFYRFRIPVAPGQEIDFPVAETLFRQNAIAVRSLDRPNFELMFSGPGVPPEIRSRIDEIIRARERLAELQAQRAATDRSNTAIFADQERLRNNLMALGDSREERDLRQRYLVELQAQEQQIKDLRAKLEDLTRQVSEQEASVSRLISALSWE